MGYSEPVRILVRILEGHVKMRIRREYTIHERCSIYIYMILCTRGRERCSSGGSITIHEIWYIYIWDTLYQFASSSSS